MANNSNNPGQPMDKEQGKQMVAIVLPVFIVGMLLLMLRCYCDRKEQQDARDGNGVREQQQSSEAGGGWTVSRAPSSTVVGAAVVVEPVRPAEPPLVCTYRMADGWRDSSCGVCLAELADGDVLRVLPACLHYFHADCVGEWLRAHATCPLCRAPLVAPAAAA